jgi:hypothetical protein
MCQHQPHCPDPHAPDRMAARAVVRRPEQGWSLLCNGVVLFEDAGELLPDGRAVPPPAATVLTMDSRAGLTPAAALAQGPAFLLAGSRNGRLPQRPGGFPA